MKIPLIDENGNSIAFVCWDGRPRRFPKSGEVFICTKDDRYVACLAETDMQVERYIALNKIESD